MMILIGNLLKGGWNCIKKCDFIYILINMFFFLVKINNFFVVKYKKVNMFV